MSFSQRLLMCLCLGVTDVNPSVKSGQCRSNDLSDDTKSTRCSVYTIRALKESIQQNDHVPRNIAICWLYSSFVIYANVTSVLRNISLVNYIHILKIPIKFYNETYFQNFTERLNKGNLAYNLVNFSLIAIEILQNIITKKFVFSSLKEFYSKYFHCVLKCTSNNEIYCLILKVFKCVAFIAYFMFLLYVFKSDKSINVHVKWSNSSNNSSSICAVSLKVNSSLTDESNIKDNKIIFRHTKIARSLFNYTVYPSSSLNLLASYRPLLYIERPDSLFFTKLSSSGFFYPGRGVSVTCVSCDNSVELIRFVSEPTSAIYHKPGCDYIKDDDTNASSNNVLPQTNETDPSSVSHYTHNDVLNSSLSSHSPNSETPESSFHAIPTSCNNQPTDQPISTSANNVSLLNPAYPMYSESSKRFESFVNWSDSHVQSPVVLVNAGFFYAGYSDCVRCFYCGLGLRSWKPGDDIYVEHERYRPTCSYLQTLNRNKQQNSTCRNSVDSSSVNVNRECEIISISVTTTEISQPNVTEPGRESLQRSNEDDRQFSRHELTQVVVVTQEEVQQPEVTHEEVQKLEVTNEEVQQLEVTHEEVQQIEVTHEVTPEVTRVPDSGSTLISENRSRQNVTKSLLQRENQALKQLMTCKSCNEAPIQDLFLPCGEMYTCKDCSNKFTHCPSCGKRILGTVTVFFT